MRRILRCHKAEVSFLYQDGVAHRALSALGGKAKIERASFIEATPGINGIEFEADLSPSGGPKLKGFRNYADAVEAEVDWINKNILTKP